MTLPLGLRRSLNPRRDEENSKLHRNVAIVGAGIAGLAVADLLRARGLSVVVLEARRRVGGRILSARIGEHTVDLGAGRFAATHAQTRAWARRLDLDLVPMYPSTGRQVFVDADRRHVGPDARLLSPDDVHGRVSHPQTWAHPLTPRSIVRNALLGARRRASWLRIDGGNHRLPARLGDRHRDVIVLGAVVRRVVQGQRGVSLDVERDDRIERWSAQRCVVTVPLATFDAIAFEPSLSEGRRRRMASIATQPAIRLAARATDRRPLRDERLNGYGCTANGDEIWQPSFSSPRDDAALVVYAQGAATRPWATLTREGRFDRLRRLLDRAFPSVGGGLVGFHEHSWTEDRWSRGAQALISDRSQRRALALNEGRLHFAGDSTAGGWVDDVLASAERVAQEIVATERESLRAAAGGRTNAVIGRGPRPVEGRDPPPRARD